MKGLCGRLVPLRLMVVVLVKVKVQVLVMEVVVLVAVRVLVLLLLSVLLVARLFSLRSCCIAGSAWAVWFVCLTICAWLCFCGLHGLDIVMVSGDDSIPPSIYGHDGDVLLCVAPLIPFLGVMGATFHSIPLYYITLHAPIPSTSTVVAW